MAGTLLVTGSVGIDTVETPLGRSESSLGGSAVYFSLAAAIFCPVRLVAAVGDDFPDDFRKILQLKQINLTGLETRANSKTFRWHGRYSPDMNDRDTVDVQLNILAEQGPPVPKRLADSKYVFLANHDPATQLELLNSLAGPQVVVCDTMDLWIENQRDGLLKVLAACDVLMINDSEARLLTGQASLIGAGRAVLDLGPRSVVIKKGEHGSMLIGHDDLFLLPAYPTDHLVDPTGAGDSFAGGMMGFLAGTDATLDQTTLREALIYATVAASFTVESFSVDGLLAADMQKLTDRRDQFLSMLP